MLIMVISGFTSIGLYEILVKLGVPLDSSILDVEKTIQEVIKGFPHIGEVAGIILDTRDAVGNAGSIGISLYMEVVSGLLLFGAYKLMYGIKKLIDQMFAAIENDTGFVVAVIEYFTMMTLVFFSVMLMSIIKRIVEIGISYIGLKWGTYVLLALIALGIALYVWLSKATWSTIISEAVFNLFFGFLTVSLIYLCMLCAQLLTMYSGVMSMREFAMTLSLEILSILALTFIGANITAKTLMSLFKV